MDICLNNVKYLFEKYESDNYMTKRLEFHLLNLLPSTLVLEDKNNKKRIMRNFYLSNEQKQFIQVFLNDNKYYYLPNNNCFYYYDGKHYRTTKEDVIQYNLLRAISRDRKLMDWKYKTKINIFKKIKERNLFNSIPESYTIQNVLRLLCPSIFTDKNQVKYFLTVLGDNLLKKHNDLIYLIKPKTKKYLQALENVSYILTGTNITTHNFMTKFHESYNYEKCRLIKMNNTLYIESWKNTLETNGLDIICVAAHYSQRYENSDNFLQYITSNEDLKKYTLYLKTHDQNSIVDYFCDKYVQKDVPDTTESSDNMRITWKNMQYIWKLYISHFSLPNVIYMNTLKGVLKNYFPFDESSDSFIYVTSKYLPRVSDFIQFWEKTITIVINTEEDDVINNELEIDELCVLFKKWSQLNESVCNSTGTITEEEVVKIMNHFFPQVEIVNNKYIIGASCTLWDKNSDINTACIEMKQFYHSKYMSTTDKEMISLEGAYNFYFQYCNKNKANIQYIVSKRYFEKYILSNMCHFIEYETFISSAWYSIHI